MTRKDVLIQLQVMHIEECDIKMKHVNKQIREYIATSKSQDVSIMRENTGLIGSMTHQTDCICWHS